MTSGGVSLKPPVPAITVTRSPRMSPPLSAPPSWTSTGASGNESGALTNGLAIAAARGSTATPSFEAFKRQPNTSDQRCAKPEPALRTWRSSVYAT